MSFHHFNLQKEALRPKIPPVTDNEGGDGEDEKKVGPPTPFVAFPTAVFAGGLATCLSPSATKEDDDDDQDNDIHALSDVETQYSTKSWYADLSEVDSMAPSRKSSASRGGFDSDDEEEDKDQEEKKNDISNSSFLQRNFVTPKTRNVRRRTREEDEDDDEMIPLHDSESRTSARSTLHQSMRDEHQSCGDSTVEEGSIASVYDRSSLGSTSNSNLRKMSPRQRYRALLNEAELQAKQARQELEIVQKQLETLQKRQLTEKDDLQRDIVQSQSIQHELRMEIKKNETEYKLVRDRLMDAVQENKSLRASLQEQQDALDVQAKEHQTEKESLQEQLRIAESAKATAEAKLDEALEKVAALQKELDQQSMNKSVRFSDQDNEVITFRSTDYASRLAQSEREKEELSSQLQSLQLEMEELEESHSNLESLHEESKVEHLQQLATEKQTVQEARSQVRDLLSSLVEMQQNAERIEKERLELETKLEEVHTSREDVTAKLVKKEKDYQRIEREVVKINKAMISLQQQQQQQQGDNSSIAVASVETGSGSSDNLLYELEKARFRLEKQASSTQEEMKALKESASKATNQYNQINDQLVVMELDKKELLHQLDDLKRTVSAMREENKRMKDERAVMEKAMTEQNELVATSQARVQELELERAALQDELTSLREKSEETVHKEGSAATTLRSIGTSGDSSRIEELETKLATAETNLQKERDQLRDRVERYHELESRLETIRKELAAVKSENESMKKIHSEEMERQLQATKDAQSRADVAHRQVEELKQHQVDTRNQLDALTESRSSLQKQLQETTDQLWFTQQERDHLQTRMAALSVSATEADGRTVQSETLKAQLEEKEADLEKLNDRLKEIQSGADAKDTQIKELQAIETALEEQIHSLCRDLDAAQSALEEAKSKITLLEKENESLRTELSEARESANLLEESNRRISEEKDSMAAEYEGRVSRLEKENADKSQRTQNLEKERDTISLTATALQNAKSDLEVKLAETAVLWGEAKEQFKLKKEEVQALRREVELQKAENASIKDKAEVSRSEHAATSQKLQDVSRQAEELQQQIALIGQQNEALEEEKAQSDSKIITLQQEFDLLKEEKGKMAEKHRALLAKETLSVSIANAKASKLEEERGVLQGQVESLMSEQSKLEQKLKETEEMWKDATIQFRRKQQRIRELERQLQMSQQSRSDLEEEKAELLQKLDEATSTRDQESKFEVELELSASKTKMALVDREARATLQQLESERRSFDSLEQSKSEELSTLESTMSQLQADLDLANAKIDALQSENVDLQKELDSTNAALCRSEEEKETSAQQVEAMRTERDRAVLSETNLRQVAEELQQKLELQTTKVKKLAKLLKRTIEKKTKSDSVPATIEVSPGTANDETKRVTRMPVVMKLRYRNKVSSSMDNMDVPAEYTGPLIDGMPNGPGMLRFESGDIYLGEFKDGEMNDNGSYVRRRSPKDGESPGLSGMFANNEFVLSSTSSSSLSNLGLE